MGGGTGNPDVVDIIDVLRSQHRKIAAVLERCETAGPLDPDAIALPTRQVLAALIDHMAAEEAWLYPEVRIDVPHGTLWADRELAEHADARKLIEEAQSLHVHHWLFAPTMSALRCHIGAHFEEEERRLFPALIGACPKERRLELGRRVRDGAPRPPSQGPN